MRAERLDEQMDDDEALALLEQMEYGTLILPDYVKTEPLVPLSRQGSVNLKIAIRYRKK